MTRREGISEPFLRRWRRSRQTRLRERYQRVEGNTGVPQFMQDRQQLLRRDQVAVLAAGMLRRYQSVKCRHDVQYRIDIGQSVDQWRCARSAQRKERVEGARPEPVLHTGQRHRIQIGVLMFGVSHRAGRATQTVREFDVVEVVAPLYRRDDRLDRGPV